MEEERRNEEVKGAHSYCGVLVRQPRRRRPTSPVRLRVHPLVGTAVELAGGERSRRGDKATSNRTEGSIAPGFCGFGGISVGEVVCGRTVRELPCGGSMVDLASGRCVAVVRSGSFPVPARGLRFGGGGR